MKALDQMPMPQWFAEMDPRGRRRLGTQVTCSGDNGECPKPVEKAGLCAGHRWRKKNGRPINTPLRQYDPWETLLAAVRAWADCESDEAFEDYARGERGRVQARLARAAVRYAESVRKERLDVTVRIVVDR